MKVSLNWIKDYIDLPADLTMEKLAYDLTMRTVEVEGWENPADGLRKVVIGQILSVEPHPDADRLRVCMVDIGAEQPLQIVCGGSNLRVGQKVVVAAPGSMVRWHGEGEPVEIKVGKLRGVRSEGMICASDELDLGGLFPAAESHEIMDLTDFPGAEAGVEVGELLKLDDMILEIDNKSMTNRPDLWGHYGIARELSAIYGLELKPLPVFELPASYDAYNVEIENPEDCPRYAATVWEGLQNGPSPYWLKLRLHLLGHNPRTLLVDLSNYVMLATGEPNHAFDHKAVGDMIRVRRARQGDHLVLLDDQEPRLSQEDILICADQEPVALAGIMGGKGHSIEADTQKIVFETAIFSPRRVRSSSQRHDIRTDSETRFEKGIDDARVDQAMALMQSLLKELQPEARITAHCDQHPQKQPETVILLDRTRVEKSLGREISGEEIEGLLKPLGFTCRMQSESELLVTVPCWRATGDVEEEADLIEEIARMIGYENFDYVAPTIELKHAVKAENFDLERRVREYLPVRCGLQEVFTYPWVEEKLLNVCGYPDEQSIAIVPPPSPETRYLRQSLLPGLIGAAKLNERYYSEFGLFEMTQVFAKNEQRNADGEPLPVCDVHLGAVLFGSDAWRSFRELKGIIEMLPRYCACEELRFERREKGPWADPEVWLDITDKTGQKLGSLSLLSLAAKKEIGFKRGDLALLEINMTALKALASRTNHFTPLPQFPLVEMDFSVLCDEGVKWEDIIAEIGKRVSSVEFKEEYRGKQVPEGKKSLMFRVRFGKEDGTMSSEEIEEKRKSLVNRLSKKLNIEIRS